MLHGKYKNHYTYIYNIAGINVYTESVVGESIPNDFWASCCKVLVGIYIKVDLFDISPMMTYLFFKRFRRRDHVCLNCLVKSVQSPYIFSHNINIIWRIFRNNIVPGVFEKITETLMRNCDGNQYNYYSCRYK